MRAVVGMRLAVQLTEPWILREPQLVLRLDLHRRGCIRQHLVVKVDVARMLDGIELVPAGMREDEHSTLPQHWLVSGEIEQIPPSHAHDQHPGHRCVYALRAEGR